MCGEDEFDMLRARALVHARGVDARGDHSCNGVAVRIRSRLHGVPSSRAHLGGSPLADLVSLLRGIGKREKERKGSNDFAHILGREGRDNREKLFERGIPIAGMWLT